MSESNNYDPTDNGVKCYNLAIRTLRLNGISEGRFEPDLDDEEEVQVALEAGFKIVRAECHRKSA